MPPWMPLWTTTGQLRPRVSARLLQSRDQLFRLRDLWSNQCLNDDENGELVGLWSMLLCAACGMVFVGKDCSNTAVILVNSGSQILSIRMVLLHDMVSLWIMVNILNNQIVNYAMVNNAKSWQSMVNHGR